MLKKALKLENKLKSIMERTKELAHGLETKAWLLRIDPSAGWQLQIAALAHDIERAVPVIEGMTPESSSREENETYDTYKAAHAKRSAIIVEHIMNHDGFSAKDIKRITNAIKNHEVGGDPDSDLVRDADSIRWFDSGHPNYIQAYGLDSAKEKGWWMYKRATKKTKSLIDSLPYDSRIKEHITNLSKVPQVVK